MDRVLKVLAWTALCVGVMCGITFIFLEPWTVPLDDPRLSASLEPNLHAGDSLLVTRTKGASLGHLVRCPDPTPGVDRWMVGRVIATSGETFFLTGGRVSRTWAQEPSRACDQTEYIVTNPATGVAQKLTCRAEDIGHTTPTLSAPDAPPNQRKFTVEPGRVFILSDDRYFHNDSQDLGQIDPASCQTVFLRLYSAEGWGDSKNRLNVLY